MFRLEFYSNGKIQTHYYVYEWLALNQFKLACAAPTEMARLYAPNGELIERFAVWDNLPKVAQVAA